DFILAVGGGSVIDSSKAIADGMGEKEYDVWEIYEKKRAPKKSIKVGAILTIAAAGSEMSDSSVISNEKTNEKRGCNSNLCRLKFVVMDPMYTMSLPDYQSMAGCTDIMMHTLERYFTQGGNMDMTDRIASELLKNVMKYATILHKKPDDYEARAEIMWCSSLSHNGLTGCGANGTDFASHRLEHELSGYYDVTHGAGLAAIWCSWARYVYKDCMDRFLKYAKDVWGIEGEDKDKVVLASIQKMEDFFKSIGMPTSIKELGVSLSDEDIEKLAISCDKGVGGKIGTAKVLHYEDFVNIYKMAR
ncbi:MAG: iron-containing alcohol dehydrogenase, partial [Lachnospiraceae bacterium]|nr:iron-containing alcohol dehydrogenase [Lachnospiraceae bacterium]